MRKIFTTDSSSAQAVQSTPQTMQSTPQAMQSTPHVTQSTPQVIQSTHQDVLLKRPTPHITPVSSDNRGSAVQYTPTSTSGERMITSRTQCTPDNGGGLAATPQRYTPVKAPTTSLLYFGGGVAGCGAWNPGVDGVPRYKTPLSRLRVSHTFGSLDIFK